MFAPLKRIMILATVLMMPAVAFATATVNSITPMPSIYPNGTTQFTLEINADWSANWESTAVHLDGSIYDCDSTVNKIGSGESEDVTQTFSGAPLAPGDYVVTVQLFQNNSCTNPYNNTRFQASAVLQVSESTDVVNFKVTKDFVPNLTNGTVNVSISCNDGEISFPNAVISEGNPHTFVVEFLSLFESDAECVITESTPSGYSASYDNNAGTPLGSNCTYSSGNSGNMGAFNECNITNTADSVTYTLFKEWDLSGTGGDLLDTTYFLVIACSEALTKLATGFLPEFLPDNLGVWEKPFGLTTDVFVEVTSLEGIPSCIGLEFIDDSSVESTFTDDCGSTLIGIPIPIDESRSCTITNTVFFEGIPTLNQYGLAIMALLMLGVGFVGFRRFV